MTATTDILQGVLPAPPRRHFWKTADMVQDRSAVHVVLCRPGLFEHIGSHTIAEAWVFVDDTTSTEDTQRIAVALSEELLRRHG